VDKKQLPFVEKWIKMSNLPEKGHFPVKKLSTDFYLCGR
jgi:hypothetical protein